MAARGPSLVLLQESYGTEDPGFLDLLHAFHDPKALAPLADRWKKDPRPWARARIFDYLDQSLDSPGHQPIIKRLLKHAEQHGDDELMAAFMVAFDRIVRRQRRRIYRYDWQTRQTWQEERLVTPSTRVAYQDPQTLQPILRPGGIFSNRTRNYLRRRAWRYFRRMAHQRPGRYPAAVAAALKQYRDDDLAKGENILDCWGLMHACFFGHDLVRFSASHASLKPEGHLAQLSAAPYKPDIWEKPPAAPILLQLLINARSRLVRVWSMQLLRRHHKDNLTDVPPAQLVLLLDHDEDEVQQFGAQLFESARGLEKLPLATWLLILKTRNLSALEGLVGVMRQHVTADRFTLPQLIDLASSQAAPVARLGLDLLKRRPIPTADDRQAIVALAGARCASIGRELALWALDTICCEGGYDVDSVAAFFDSLTPEIRLGAWEWLTPASPAYSDPILFSRLLETPYEDLRLRLVEMLEQRSALPGTTASSLPAIWCPVLLGIHRGGRHKLKALRQIGQAVRQDPAQAESLIPVLAIAIRSVRFPEARHGLAALVAAVEAEPRLAAAVQRFLPELDLAPREAAL